MAEKTVDGKLLRGSKRWRGEEALVVVTMAGQALRGIVAQRHVEGGDELAAALELLEEVSLEGKIVSADAGRLKTPCVQKVVEKGGLYRVGEEESTGGEGCLVWDVRMDEDRLHG